ncbi:MAG: hypothetical protein U0487_03215 [Patescibacteria group bacterium]
MNPSTKPRTALLHGFAIDAEFSRFRPALGADAGFEAFRDEVAKGEVSVFRWGIPKRFALWQIVSLGSILNLYRAEERRAADPEWQQKLFRFLEDGQIETVVCHSLGCRFLLDTINRFGAPASLKKIVFVQADIAQNQAVTDQNTINRLHDGSLKLVNVYCAWDKNLIASSILTGRMRYGMAKVIRPNVENVFMPLKTLPNLHTCSIKSKELHEFILR